LDSACGDLDGDGDIDIVAPARCGLHWLENLRVDAAAKKSNLDRPLPTSMTTQAIDRPIPVGRWQEASGQWQPVTNALDHGHHRQQILRAMQEVMGPLPNSVDRLPLDIQITKVEQRDSYWRIWLSYSAGLSGHGLDRVPAILLVPQQATSQQARPAMLCLHQTQASGKAESAGLGGDPHLHLADQLARRGFVCLAPDYPSFGDYAFDFFDRSNPFASGTMKGLWNHVRGLDLLESLACVRRDSIGAIGHSLGGHNALFLAALDQRVRCVVSSCGFNAFEHYDDGNLSGWSSDRYMPRIASQYGNDPKRMPFDFPAVLAAIAPRPLFVNAPLHDANFSVKGVRLCEQSVRPIYQLLKAEKSLTFVYPDAQHEFPEQQRDQAYEWLSNILSFPARAID
jgi:dienelactone hydrolase